MKLFMFIVFFVVTSSILPFKTFAQTLTPTPTEEALEPSVDSYQLPYPGILPDSPLYVLKVIRDKIVGFLISDPLTKADFDVLQADKRLSASVYLQKFSPQKQDLIVSTVSKAENYFQEAIDQVNLAKTQGINVTEELGKLASSSKKHDEVIEDIATKLSPHFAQQINAEEKRVKQYEIMVNRELPNSK